MSKLFDAHAGDYVQLDQGLLDFEGNELHLKTAYNDPPAVSFHNDFGDSLGKLSGKHNGEEQVLVQFKRNAAGGEFYLGVLDQAKYVDLQAKGDPKALDHAMIEAMNVSAAGIEFRLPVKFSAGQATPTPGPLDPPTNGVQLGTLDGRYIVADQSDGNLVVYDRGIAVWDRWSYEAAKTS